MPGIVRRVAVAALAWATLCAPSLAAAAAPPAPPDTAAPLSSFELPNGLEIALQEDHSRPGLSLMLGFDVGSDDDPPGYEGLTELTSRCLLAARTSRGARKLIAQLAAFHARPFAWLEGVSVGPSERRLTTWTLEGDSSMSEPALWALAEQLADGAAHVDASVVQEERAKLAKLALSHQPSGMSELTEFDFALYGAGSPRGRWITASSLASIDARIVRWWASRWFTLANARLAVFGDVGREEFAMQVRRQLGTLPRGRRQPARRSFGSPRAGAMVQVPSDRAGAALVWETAPFGAADDLALDVTARVLSQRLAARDPHGERFEVAFARQRSDRPVSAFFLVASAKDGASPEAVLEQLLVARASIDGSPPTESELAAARGEFEVDAWYAAAQPRRHTAWLLHLDRTHPGWPDVPAYALGYRSIGLADVQRVLRERLPAATAVRLLRRPNGAPSPSPSPPAKLDLGAAASPSAPREVPVPRPGAVLHASTQLPTQIALPGGGRAVLRSHPGALARVTLRLPAPTGVSCCGLLDQIAATLLRSPLDDGRRLVDAMHASGATDVDVLHVQGVLHLGFTALASRLEGSLVVAREQLFETPLSPAAQREWSRKRESTPSTPATRAVAWAAYDVGPGAFAEAGLELATSPRPPASASLAELERWLSKLRKSAPLEVTIVSPRAADDLRSVVVALDARKLGTPRHEAPPPRPSMARFVVDTTIEDVMLVVSSFVPTSESTQRDVAALRYALGEQTHELSDQPTRVVLGRSRTSQAQPHATGGVLLSSYLSVRPSDVEAALRGMAVLVRRCRDGGVSPELLRRHMRREARELSFATPPFLEGTWLLQLQARSGVPQPVPTPATVFASIDVPSLADACRRLLGTTGHSVVVLGPIGDRIDGLRTLVDLPVVVVDSKGKPPR